jgi:2-methylcitrate dehydratase PrpD
VNDCSVAPTVALTRRLAEDCAAVTVIGADIRTLATQCLLDFFGCALAGAREPAPSIVFDEMAAAAGAPAATLIGRGTRLPVLSAALVNGTAAHALDYDDVNMALPGHPSVAILPALLACAEEAGASGSRVLTSFAAGYDLMCRLGRTMSPGHYTMGFHSTATLGSVGAAAACGHLLGLQPSRLAEAIGIAATQAAGLKSLFGTMCKPLHAGKAAYHGLLAVRLAVRGFSSRGDVLECAQGFGVTHSADFTPARDVPPAQAGETLRGNLFKYHAACYLTHATLEAIRSLREDHALRPDQVARIVLRLDRSCGGVCNIERPATGLEAKFSLRFAAAAALAGVDTSRLDAFTDGLAADANLVALRDKVAVEFQEGWPQTLTVVSVRTRDGRELEARHDAGIPATDLVAQGRRLRQKFEGLVAPCLGGSRTEALARAVEDFSRCDDVGAVMRLCAVAGARP